MAKVLRTQHAPAAVRKEYHRRLLKMVRDMNRSVEYWLLSAYRKNEGRIVKDEAPEPPSKVPSTWLSWALRRLQRFWTRKWRDTAETLASWFVSRTQSSSGNQMKAAMKAAGFTVKMAPTRATNDVVKALIAENVALIKSIPERYFGDIESLVQRSVSQGKDIQFLRDELQNRFSVTENRAKLIARDQSDKAFQAIKRSECKDLGITEGIWVHVPGTKQSRRTHMQMNGKRFKLDEGLYDSDLGRKVLPGEAVACRCTYRAVIPEFGDTQ